jgi:hypothetical protein
VHSGLGLTVQFGWAWCTLSVSGWVWRRSETASSLGTHSIASSEKKQPCFRIKYKNNMYLATLWWLPYVCGNFHRRLCSMHKSAKWVNIGRNSETESPIGPHFIARSRKKQRWPICSIIFWNNILWCLQYVCRNFFLKYGPVNLGSIFNYSDNFLSGAGLRAVSKVAQPIGTSACQLPWNRPRIIPWVHTCSKMYTLWYLMPIIHPQNE